MDTMPFNYNLEDQKPIFTTASDTKSTSTETFAPADGSMSVQESVFSPMAAPFQAHGGNLMHLLEPRPADTAPTAAEIDMMNYRISDADSLFGDNSHQNFYMGGGSGRDSRTESVTSTSMQWGDSGVSSSSASARSGEMVDTFDFLVKSLSSANNYVSMLTRDQLSVLRAIRPSLLYEFLQEVAKVRVDKRTRRALPNECAFCKNNGENEECYSTHALKDWRGRVLCPVLRAFRCPRCGATGERAHTIKYCPENNDAAAERQGLPPRRRNQPTPLMMGQMGHAMGRAPQTPQSPQSPPGMPPKAAWWSAYGIN